MINISKDFKEYFGSTKGTYIPALLVSICQKRYSAKDLGISYRRINSWQSERLIEDFREDDQKWRKFSFVDYIWIRIVDDLRNYGLSIPIIRRIKDEIHSDIESGENYWISFNTNSKTAHIAIPSTASQILRQKLESYSTTEEIKGVTMTQVQFHEMDSEFTGLSISLMHSILENDELFLVVNTGDLCILSHKMPSLDKILDQGSSFLTLSIREYFGAYLQMEGNSKVFKHTMLLSDNEVELLNELRNNNFDSATINYKEGSPVSIKLKQKSQKINPGSTLEEHIIKGGYQDITYKTVNGKIVSFENTRTKKL